MSLIPLDDRRGDDRQTPPEGQSQRGGVGSLFQRVRSVITAVADRFRGSEDDQQAVEALPDEGLQTGETIETLRTELELVSSKDDETLTVTDADNPEATITSDTWESVER
jgi:hypothetical protein